MTIITNRGRGAYKTVWADNAVVTDCHRSNDIRTGADYRSPSYFHITFDDSAIDEIIRKAVEIGEEAGPMTFQLAKKLEYGLKLVRERAGMDNFIITREAVTDMESYINGLVKKFYQQEDEDD